jgi:hypothetical protein
MREHRSDCGYPILLDIAVDMEQMPMATIVHRRPRRRPHATAPHVFLFGAQCGVKKQYKYDPNKAKIEPAKGKVMVQPKKRIATLAPRRSKPAAGDVRKCIRRATTVGEHADGTADIEHCSKDSAADPTDDAQCDDAECVAVGSQADSAAGCE